MGSHAENWTNKAKKQKIKHRTINTIMKLNGMLIHSARALVAGVVWMCPFSGQASLIGDNLTVDYHYPDINSVFDAGQTFSVASGGTSFTRSFSGTTFEITVTADTITISDFQNEN